MISPLAQVHPNATIGENVEIGPFTVIDEDVKIGDNCIIKSNVVIRSGTSIGQSCKFYPGAIVGEDPQDLKYNGEETNLIIGDHVTVREFCTLNRGTSESLVTEIGSHVLLMAYVHVAHDCKIGDHVILSNCVNLAGHVKIGHHAILGGMVPVHQFVTIGDHAFIGGGTLVRKDVPPFIKAAREPISYVGVNSIGLSRRGFSQDDINIIQNIYRILFIKNKNIKDGLEQVNSEFQDGDMKQKIVSFITESERGVIKGFIS